MPFHKTAKLEIGFLLLREQDVVDIVILGTGQFKFPIDQFAVHLLPLLGIHPVLQLHTYLTETLLVTHSAALVLQTAHLGMLLHREPYLVGVDGLDKVVANLTSQGILHQVLLFALGNHHHWQLGPALLDAGQGVYAAQSGHLLIQKHHIHPLTCLLLFQLVYGIGPRIDRHHRAALLLKEKDMRLQQVYLIIGPKYLRVHSFSFVPITSLALFYYVQ